MDTPYEHPDPRLVPAVNELADAAKRNARQAREARSDLAASARAFFGPSLRAVGLVILIVLLVAGAVEQRRNGPSAA